MLSVNLLGIDIVLSMQAMLILVGSVVILPMIGSILKSL